MIPQLKEAERLDLGDAVIYIVSSSRIRSEGYIELQPGKEMPHYRRSSEEHLMQQEGESLVTTFDERGEPELHRLEKGSELRIPPGYEHIHANPYGRVSYTKWICEGDVTETLAAQRMKGKRLVEERSA